MITLNYISPDGVRKQKAIYSCNFEAAVALLSRVGCFCFTAE